MKWEYDDTTYHEETESLHESNEIKWYKESAPCLPGSEHKGQKPVLALAAGISSTAGRPGRGQVYGMEEPPRCPVNACQVMGVTSRSGDRGEVSLSQRYSSAHGVVTCWGCYRSDPGIGRAWVKRMRALYSPFQARGQVTLPTRQPAGARTILWSSVS